MARISTNLEANMLKRGKNRRQNAQNMQKPSDNWRNTAHEYRGSVRDIILNDFLNGSIHVLSAVDSLDDNGHAS